MKNYLLRFVDDDTWKKARMKSIEHDSNMGEVIRQLLKLWVDNKVVIKEWSNKKNGK